MQSLFTLSTCTGCSNNTWHTLIHSYVLASSPQSAFLPFAITESTFSTNYYASTMFQYALRLNFSLRAIIFCPQYRLLLLCTPIFGDELPPEYHVTGSCGLCVELHIKNSLEIKFFDWLLWPLLWTPFLLFFVAMVAMTSTMSSCEFN